MRQHMGCESVPADHVLAPHDFTERAHWNQDTVSVCGDYVCGHGNIVPWSLVQAILQLLGGSDTECAVRCGNRPSNHERSLQFDFRSGHASDWPANVSTTADAVEEEDTTHWHLQLGCLRHRGCNTEQGLFLLPAVRQRMDILVRPRKLDRSNSSEFTVRLDSMAEDHRYQID